jgi:nicotinate-nucleotide adenylyltransferase
MKTFVAFYGLSANPVTLGHVMVLSHLLLNDPSVEKILVVPCYQQVGKKLAPYNRRVEYCQAGFGWLPKVEVSRIEEGTFSITVETIRRLKREHPDWNLRFVMGADLLDTAPAWAGWEELKRLAPPLTVGRAGIQSYDTPTPICPAVSSTIVREGLWEGRYADVERYLPRPVLDLIKEDENYLDPKKRRQPVPQEVEG